MYILTELYDVYKSIYTTKLFTRAPVNDISVNLQVKRDVGEVDILVNNAGIVTGKKFLDCPDHMIQKTFEVNTIAHFWVRKHAFKKKQCLHALKNKIHAQRYFLTKRMFH